MKRSTPTQNKAKVFVGTSGFTYKHWGNGVFYPKETPQRKWLEFYAEHFNTVELNVTFYRLPTEDTFRSWHKRTPEAFRFALKGSRFITHVKRLKDCREPLKLYFKRARLLQEKLSVVLWQLPPQFQKDAPRLKDFLKTLRHYRSVRHVFEFRDTTWFHQDVYELLNEMNTSTETAICMADRFGGGAGIPETAGFVYLRRHGPESGRLYTGCYSGEALRRDARRIKKWLSAGKDVYLYFNNDAHGWAVKNAQGVRNLI